MIECLQEIQLLLSGCSLLGRDVDIDNPTHSGGDRCECISLLHNQIHGRKLRDVDFSHFYL